MIKIFSSLGWRKDVVLNYSLEVQLHSIAILSSSRSLVDSSMTAIAQLIRDSMVLKCSFGCASEQISLFPQRQSSIKHRTSLSHPVIQSRIQVCCTPSPLERNSGFREAGNQLRTSPGSPSSTDQLCIGLRSQMDL